MPQKVWAIGEEVLAADFNTYVQQQTFAIFASVAQRDAQWVSPPDGAHCVTTDTGRSWERRAGQWAYMLPFRSAQVNPTLGATGEAAVVYATPFASGTSVVVMLENPLANFQAGMILGYHDADHAGFVLTVKKHDGTNWAAGGVYVSYIAMASQP